ncbi:MAG: polysaccharide biosynthesis C-terminal domain-containing protein [Flavobacteriales bacterium]|nr:polysaccharide biosynthesis C-terminal domain-containing protein [Flavobacteriales bacterium]
MIRPVIGTVATRVAITAMNLLLVVVAGQNLGAAGLGTIGLVVLGITLILLIGNIIGGGGLVYLIPRYGVRPLLAPSYAWVLVTAGVAIGLQRVVPFLPDDLAGHVVALATLQAINSIHLNILLGRERIAQQNGILVVQMAIQLAAFIVLIRLGAPTVMDHIHATYIAHGATVLISAYAAFAHMGKEDRGSPLGSSLAALFKQGLLAQGANLLQLLNYRLAYYLIEHFRGLVPLGVFSVTTQLAESTWLIPKSIGGVLYSKVSNLEAAERQRDLTVILFKTVVVTALVCCGLLLVIPDTAYTFVFGPEIHDLHPLLMLMVPGLVAMSASQVLSHFLSGTGRVLHNTIGSGLGLVVTVVAGLVLIPTKGLMGAAITTSLAYGTSVTYQLTVFLRTTGSRLSDLVPHAGDRARFHALVDRLKDRIGL